MSQNIIEINGKRYDAISGALVEASQIHSKGRAASQHPIKPAEASSKAVVSSANTSNASDTPSASHPAKTHQAHQLASYINAHKTQASKTFHRQSVKKPSVSQKPAIKVSAPSQSQLSKKASVSLVKLPTASIDPKRAERAHLASKTASVQHFNKSASAPSRPPAARAATPNPKTGRTFDIAPPPRRQPLHERPSLAATAAPASIASLPPKSQFSGLLERHEKTTQHRYLESPKAKSRRLAKLKPGHKRAVSFGAVGLSLVLLAGFFVFQYKTNIELQLADAKAGIHATLPGYKPSGYAVSKFSYQAGLVAINYHSSDDGHHFQLLQKASGYADQSSLSSLVADNAGSYQKLEAGGQTIYASSDNSNASAAWLNGGILYLLKGNASLSNDQIQKIVTST